ncbi:methyltransferase domain-containing protein [Diaporthe amygdali]|uniref:methyltransferase domain-containing protein n=1 Tax=Phomopsis amygdali TaxID=1214568 RepID=UPI0022FF3A52|nr:methyltransferase domain-containing protein [Diaporthe amygdali]KAJ0123112.1 methyltransferase domain-containing protein [Diaporthe amygdali]
MSQQHSPASSRSPHSAGDQTSAGGSPRVPSQGDSKALSDDRTETETISGDGTIVDMYSCVGEDGRTYQGYQPGGEETEAPKAEQHRLDFSHALYRLMLDDKLAAAPIREPEHALDIGTGTGIWALQFAEENPTCQVTGTDLSLIQPLSWMPNCQFVMENSELQDWLLPHKLDYVHLRGMTACFNDVTTVMRRSFDALTAGGWIEFQEGCFHLHGVPNDDALEGTAIGRWCQMVAAGAANAGRDLTKARLYKQQLAETGFVDVHEQVIRVPGGPWSDESKAKLMGAYLANTFLMGAIDSFKKLLGAARELSPPEMDELTEQVKQDVQNPEIRWYMPMYIVYGRKPYEGEVAGT